MRKLMLAILILGGLVAWQRSHHRPSTPVAVAEEEVADETADPARASRGYACDGRQYCSQMTSCEEATYFLQHCPNVKMDGDHDGIPCERQWCATN